ncbi:ATP-binding protein [Spongiactinospora gelatinilytica]|uniref:ATP-binding protein n=1 Tax=Spongiactinospora gelatinilytica TaxID=2666298 RepID=A0A2W2H4I5_9ACTN|nr:ATP-binding protein [Spongiactinospora gelatinilytica]
MRRFPVQVSHQSLHRFSPRPAPGEIVFGVAELQAVRAYAAAYVRALGLADDWVADFLVATNEVATNAVIHGAGVARLRVWDAGGQVVAEVYDEGVWPRAEGEPELKPPGPYPTGGMGLWLAHTVASGFRLSTGAAGTTVTLWFDRGC